MNNQELENQPKAKVDVTKRRRFLQKAGIVAPVLLTFKSPTAFGFDVACASDLLSGNTSPTVGQALNCQTGSITPSSLAPPKSNAANSADNPALAQAQTTNFPSINGYGPDTVFNSVFQLSGITQTFGDIVARNTESRESIFIAAFMNSQASKTYVLSSGQVVDLYNNPSNRPAGYMSDIDFLLATFDH